MTSTDQLAVSLVFGEIANYVGLPRFVDRYRVSPQDRCWTVLMMLIWTGQNQWKYT